MSLVAAYSDSEDEGETPAVSDKGKRYLKAAALLPPEIRAALEGKVEDDEDDERAAWVAGPEESSSMPPRRSDHKLLAMLPAARTGLPEEEAKPKPKPKPAPPPREEPGSSSSEEEEGPTPDRLFRLPTKNAESKPERRQQKRRALETALMEGDVSALDGEEVVEVRGRADTRTPEQLAATSEFTGEVRVAASFYNPKTGTNIQTLRPSKLQRRRHQINSLAVSAAERELELLEKKNVSTRTKHQTQSRYGW
ncbi:hypothetical protein CTAYLR_001442 [Chrysophaeum taylorii]|uniref:Proline-rich protein PRCC n=1 Tax=Chrysophaeum taylorii TaxID=2483200 RepID=A0AAD7UB37_9STRA|nr:hypothetical protein CTAYLR_001442 [Chrysophaeum taylorii]